MKKLSFLLLVMLSVSTFSFAQEIDYGAPKTYTLEGIEVEGCEYYDNVSVILKSDLKIGDELTIPGPQISDAVKNLWKENIFSDISIEVDNIVGDKIFLRIIVQELPRISRFTFEGITKSQAEDLREKIQFIRGTRWTEEKATRARRVVRNYFVEKGYYNIDIDITTAPDEFMSNGLAITINIDKGPRIKINEIKLIGNQEFRDSKLKAKMKTTKEKKWWRVWKRSKFQPGEFDEAKDNLINFYNAEGYRDAKITFDTVYAYDDKTIDVEVQIKEGRQYYFREIDWVGNYKYRDGILDTLFGIKRGDIYNRDLMQQRISGDVTGKDISALYLDDGYLFFSVDPVEVLIEGDSIDLEMRVTEGPQARIRKIIVEGNTKTSDYVILRELRTLPGQKFSRADLIRSQREILNLGFFNQETMNVVPLPDPQNGTVDIKYVVEEKPSDQLQLQGGWGGRVRNANGDVIGGGFVGTLSLAFNNFSTKRFFKKNAWNPIPSGDGQRLSLAAQVTGTGWQNYSISFLEPWVGGKKPNSLGTTVFYTINRSLVNSFRMNTFGTTIDYGRRMKWPDDFFRSFTSLGYKYYDIQNGGSIFGTGSTSQLDNGFINVLTLRQSFDRTSIDAPLFPRSGSAFSLSVEATPPYSMFGIYNGQDLREVPNNEKYNLLEYHKWKFSALWYHEVFKNLVVRPKMEFGFLGTYNRDYGVSPFERFIMGGSGFGGFNFYGLDYISLRGYPDNSLGSQTGGGNIYNKYSLELRYPLSLNQSAPIWALLYAEAGNTWNGFDKYDPFDLKRATGLGIRVVLPMVGLLGVDWGWGWDPVPGATQPNGAQFNFVIGQEF